MYVRDLKHAHTSIYNTPLDICTVYRMQLLLRTVVSVGHSPVHVCTMYMHVLVNVRCMTYIVHTLTFIISHIFTMYSVYAYPHTRMDMLIINGGGGGGSGSGSGGVGGDGGIFN